MSRGFRLILLTLLPVAALWFYLGSTSQRQDEMLAGARSRLGDVYDSSEFPDGPAPRGRGACTDVVYEACKPVVDLQTAVNEDVASNPKFYPGSPNPNLDFRWCPKLIIWFERHTERLPVEVSWSTLHTFQAGDIIFYDDGSGGVGHVGVVSDRWAWTAQPFLIHNPAPVCVEENALTSNKIMGHFRLR